MSVRRKHAAAESCSEGSGSGLREAQEKGLGAATLVAGMHRTGRWPRATVSGRADFGPGAMVSKGSASQRTEAAKAGAVG